MLKHYILNKKGRPIRCSFWTWARWFEKTSNRVIAQTQMGRIMVSTIFLGIDHNFSDHGPPILWETLVLGGPSHGDGERCAGSREQAEAGHMKWVEKMLGKAIEAKTPRRKRSRILK